MRAVLQLAASPATHSLLRTDAIFLGATLSQLLDTAGQEARESGSRTLQSDALHALDAVLHTVCSAYCEISNQAQASQVNDPDALAFFLPGVASGLCRRLCASTSGEAAAHALRGLTTLLRLTLVRDQHSASPPSALPVADELLRVCKPKEHGAVLPAAADEARTESPTMRVERNAAWRSSAASRRVQSCVLRAAVSRCSALLPRRLAKMLPPVFRRQRTHARPSVRSATAQSCDALITCCSSTLCECVELWLESLLLLAQDDWPQVSSVAGAALSRMAVTDGGAARDSVAWPLIQSMLQRSVAAFDGSCLPGRDVTSSARLLTGLISLAGPTRSASVLLALSTSRSVLIGSLLKAFRVSSGQSEHLISPQSYDVHQVLSTSLASLAPPRRCVQLDALCSDEVNR